ncbi:MAG TPA: tRNA uridine(34) 5-carboxymethylaminomethyl modification radical SAM/GNAT enzyme Elp3 [bacterium]|nr:tRNA uridine(34) 5-carboxymethylaminomethyl modification radical SAM/GNAT enzyme Elp3 [bacterium]HNS34349.1 tRNA uridine(34) 5-carboxymethylaminomethyl modification radical SAM/GNAT enzyme Elp3 [bacterium]HNZ73544.1 tRNA uridine(34) 5-carboxymethylaminomethyl modification radical SAM/GNAT enzyme Elp3 [bacterium]HOH67544.1 tRNA uridine(34) 5-carboxymethylaminomethyl modification radical SAM/GNAT enzyme Elp3 [bacterium]
MTPKNLEKIITALVQKNPQTEKDFFILVRKQAGQLLLPPPEKSQLLAAYRRLVKNKKIRPADHLEKLLTKRAVRTLSGVAVISVLTKPLPCPGNCLYCPTETNMPKSYLSNEPAVMRAILNDFDPYRQIQTRLKALKANGHNTDKIELIVMGGTWSHHSPQYQSWFIKRCFEALNGRRANSLIRAQHQNETAKHRCIGLTLETRPDFITKKEIVRLRRLGCTRVELGLQHLNDKILKLNRRGHSAKDSAKAISLLRTAGFKINFHLMLNLPGSTPTQDLNMFKKIYRHPDWLPDMVKIYPCVVNQYADLYKLWQQKKYRPYTNKQLIELIKKIKKITPPWVRITRLIRDIPKESIVAGNKITNLRQLIQQQSVKEGWQCQCLRCREAGHQNKNFKFKTSNLKLKIIKYAASGGSEYFLSYETRDDKILYAFLRLRLNSQPKNNFMAELKNTAIIRELHTYGQLAPLNQTGAVQHLGLGKKLLQQAEKITRQHQLKKIAVISGIGVREYYRKNGYNLEGSYMVKTLERPITQKTPNP